MNDVRRGSPDRHNIDWKLILKKNGDEMYRPDGKLNLAEPQYKLDFNPFPSSAVQRKIDYYFLEVLYFFLFCFMEI